MSSKKRRTARQIRRLVRMNMTRERMREAAKADAFWHACLLPLGKKLGRLGLKHRTSLALARAGATIKGIEPYRREAGL